MAPPYWLIIASQSWGTEEDPCITRVGIGNTRELMSLIRSMAEISPVADG